MSFKTTLAACMLVVMTSLAVGSAPVLAGQSKTIVLTPNGKQAEALREGLRIYGWAQAAGNRATVDQRGTGNGAGIAQHGKSNWGAIIQRGKNNSATLAQNGNNNALAIFQVGRGQRYDANQTGNGKTGVIIQVGR